jgi:hypothetical protein
MLTDRRWECAERAVFGAHSRVHFGMRAELRRPASTANEDWQL